VRPFSVFGLDIAAPIIFAMDIVAVLLGVFMFAVLLGLVYGIERV
jgi:hypothetical protein